MLSAMTVGRRCGERLFGNIICKKCSVERRRLSNEHRLYLQLAMPHLRSLYLNLLWILLKWLLLSPLLCRKPRGPIPHGFPRETSAELPGSGETLRIKDQMGAACVERLWCS
jgi:hypothetical protein